MANSLILNRLNLFNKLLNNTKFLQIVPKYDLIKQKKCFSSEVTATAVPKPKKEVTSKAMKAYLERAHEHEEFMKKETLEFEIGKRHLANMMGEDPETFTQAQIDEAIEYLFPSGLYDKKARPIMKPPQEIFPQRKAAEFDESGKPHHSMFYTGQPNFFKLLYDIVETINVLNSFEDRMIRKNSTPDPNLRIDMSGTTWLSKEDLKSLLVEDMSDIEYDNFVNAMQRLVELPYSYRSIDFINKYRKPLMNQKDKYEIAKPMYDETGRAYVTIYECLRKSARGDVTLRFPGTGIIKINGNDISFFTDTQSKEQVSSLFLFS